MNSMSPGPSEVSRPTRSPGFSSTGPEVVRSCTPISRAISMASVVLPRPGGPKKSVWSSVSRAALGRVDRDLERALHLRLADELVQPRRPERGVGAGLLGQGFGGGDLQSVHPVLRLTFVPWPSPRSHGMGTELQSPTNGMIGSEGTQTTPKECCWHLLP